MGFPPPLSQSLDWKRNSGTEQKRICEGEDLYIPTHSSLLLLHTSSWFPSSSSFSSLGNERSRSWCIITTQERGQHWKYHSRCWVVRCQVLGSIGLSQQYRTLCVGERGVIESLPTSCILHSLFFETCSFQLYSLLASGLGEQKAGGRVVGLGRVQHPPPTYPFKLHPHLPLKALQRVNCVSLLKQKQ